MTRSLTMLTYWSIVTSSRCTLSTSTFSRICSDAVLFIDTGRGSGRHTRFYNRTAMRREGPWKGGGMGGEKGCVPDGEVVLVKLVVVGGGQL